MWLTRLEVLVDRTEDSCLEGITILGINVGDYGSGNCENGVIWRKYGGVSAV